MIVDGDGEYSVVIAVQYSVDVTMEKQKGLRERLYKSLLTDNLNASPDCLVAGVQ